MNSARRVLLALAPLSLLALGGCASHEGADSKAVLQNAARGVLIGQNYDHASIAVRNGDEAGLQEAQKSLQAIAPQLAAQQAVKNAILLDSEAQSEKDPKRADELRERAAKKYREALAITPDFSSSDPDELNALGYFLAERGTSTSDFQTAEKLTRRALAIWDDLVSDANGISVPGVNQVLAVRRFLRANTRDSLAWALFRQGQYAAAQKEQEAAIQEAEHTAPQIKQKIPADLYYHLGEIYRAQKQTKAAKMQYEKALAAEPDHKLSQRALQSLTKSLSETPSAKTTAPQVTPQSKSETP